MTEIDERFEFDAPRWFDFETMTDCSLGDKWFDTAPEGPGMVPPKDKSREPLKSIQTGGGDGGGGVERAGAAAADKGKGKAAQQQEQQPPAAGENGAAAAAKKPAVQPSANIVTSWGVPPPGGHKRTRAQTDVSSAAAAATSGGAGPSASSAAAAAVAPLGPTKTPVAKPAVAPAAAPPGGGGANKARRVSAAQTAPRSETRVTRSMSRLMRLAFTPIPERKAKHFSPPKTRKAATAAKPRTPAHKRGGGGATGARLRQVLQPKISKPVRSTKPLTLPEDFDLATSRRARSGKAAEAAPAPSPFKSLAEKVLDFQAKTPQRFKAGSKGAAPAAGNRTASAGASRGRARDPHQPQCTEAKTPVLWTSTRVRPRRFKTREEEEEEEMRAAGLHAKPASGEPANRTAKKAPDTAPRRGPTEPKPFSFAVDRRAESRSRGRALVADGHGAGILGAAGAGAAAAGRAGPQTRQRAAALLGGGRSILDGGAPSAPDAQAAAAGPSRAVSAGRQRPVSAGRARPSLTIPQSPLLRTKARHHSPPPQREAPRSKFRARPAPTFDSFGAKSVPFVAPKEPTHPVPFRLATDDRHRQHEAQQQAKVEAERRMEERRRRVSARPLPASLEVPAVPPRPAPREPTLPAPYRLRSEARHAEAAAKQAEELQREEQARRRASEFKARPVWSGKPFVVHESDAPLTVPAPVHLATENRAGERGEFDRTVAERTAAVEAEKRRQEELKRQREEEETQEYRRSLRFKARPMPTFEDPFFSRPSEKPLTNAKTPNFSTKKRSRAQ